MKNKLFYSEDYQNIEHRLIELLNSQQPENLGIAKTAREAGDRIGTFISQNFEKVLLTEGSNINIDSAYKKQANVSFRDKDGFTYFIDVISHNVKTKFSRPNITAVPRLIELYKNDKNIFVILLIHFNPSLKTDFIVSVELIPIEFISWDCLGFGLLGNGQIQIVKSSDVKVKKNYSRKKWMLEFSKKLNRFYVGAAEKIVKNLRLAIDIEEKWEIREDTW